MSLNTDKINNFFPQKAYKKPILFHAWEWTVDNILFRIGFLLNLLLTIPPIIILLILIFVSYNPIIYYIRTILSIVSILFFFGTFLSTKEQFKVDKLFFLFLCLAVIGFCSALLGNDFSVSLRPALEICYYPLFSLMVLNLVDSRVKLKWIIITLVFAAFFQASIGILEYIFNAQLFPNKDVPSFSDTISVASTTKVRVGGTWDPNFFGVILVSAIPLAIIMTYINKRILMKIVFLTGLILLILGLVYSFTRTAMFAVVVAFLFLIYKNKAGLRVSPVKIFSLLIVLILTTGIIYYSNFLYLSTYIERIKSSSNILSYDAINFSSPNQNFSIAFRLVHYKEAIRMIRSNPLLGVGPGNSIYDMAKHAAYPRYIGNIHNMFLLITAEYGILALFIYLCIIAVTWNNYIGVEKIARENKDKEMELMIIGLQASMLTFLVMLQTQPFIFPLGLLLIYSLSEAIKHNILTKKEVTHA